MYFYGGNYCHVDGNYEDCGKYGACQPAVQGNEAGSAISFS